MNTYYLQLMLTRGIGPRTLHNVLIKLQERQETVEDFFALDSTKLQQEFGLRKASIAALHQNEAVAEDYLVSLNAKNIQMLILGQPGYPQKLYQSLGDKAPPLLFYWGNLSLLDHCTVGFCGARDVSDQGLNAIIDTSTQLAQANINIISGHARGTDMAAHKAALEANGKTTLVIPEGILVFQMRVELKTLADKERILILSQFSPRLPWRAHNAMVRNETICGLSDAMVVIESKLKGGTFAAGRSALQLHKPLFVVEYANPAQNAMGNAYFIERGAKPLRRIKQTGQANVKPILLTISGCELTTENDETPQHKGRNLTNLNIAHAQSSMSGVL